MVLQLGDWRNVDVILSSMSQSFDCANDIFSKVSFHRVVLDESAMMFQNPSFLKIRAQRRWSATGTPCAMSVMPLLKQGNVNFYLVISCTPLFLSIVLHFI